MSKHCVRADCYTFAHTVEWCGKPEEKLGVADHLMSHPEHRNFDYGGFGDPSEMFERMDEYELHQYQHGAIAFIRHYHTLGEALWKTTS